MKKVVKYILGIFFILGGIGSFPKGAVGAGIIIIILGVLFLPPISDSLKEKFKFWQNKGLRYVSYIILFFTAGIFLPKDLADTKISKKSEVNNAENIIKTKIEEKPVISYKIDNEAVISAYIKLIIYLLTHNILTINILYV